MFNIFQILWPKKITRYICIYIYMYNCLLTLIVFHITSNSWIVVSVLTLKVLIFQTFLNTPNKFNGQNKKINNHDKTHFISYSCIQSVLKKKWSQYLSCHVYKMIFLKWVFWNIIEERPCYKLCTISIESTCYI